MANIRKQATILGFLIFLDLLSCVSGEFTADAVHGLTLSIFEIKSDMANIKRRIENLEKKVQDTCISTTVSPQLEGRALTGEEIMGIKEDLNMQAVAIQKTLAAEKLRLRETVETFESKFAELESKIEKNIGSINASLEGKAEVMFDRINSSSSALAEGIAKLTSDFNYTTTLINASLEGMAEVMFDRINSSSSALAEGIAKLTSDFNYTSTLINASLEGKAEVMFDKINSSSTALANSVAKLTSDFNYTTVDIRQSLKTVETTIMSDVRDIETRMIAMVEKRTLALKPYVAFNAYNTRSWTPRIHGEIVVFQNAYLNIGGGYDTTSGVFKAPVYGLYLFSAHFCNDIYTAIAYTINYGGTNIATSTVTDQWQSSCGSVTAVARIHPGETVTVRGNYNRNQLTEDYHRQSSFIGVLIHA